MPASLAQNRQARLRRENARLNDTFHVLRFAHTVLFYPSRFLCFDSGIACCSFSLLCAARGEAVDEVCWRVSSNSLLQTSAPDP